MTTCGDITSVTHEFYDDEIIITTQFTNTSTEDDKYKVCIVSSSGITLSCSPIGCIDVAAGETAEIIVDSGDSILWDSSSLGSFYKVELWNGWGLVLCFRYDLCDSLTKTFTDEEKDIIREAGKQCAWYDFPCYLDKYKYYIIAIMILIILWLARPYLQPILKRLE